MYVCIHNYTYININTYITTQSREILNLKQNTQLVTAPSSSCHLPHTRVGARECGADGAAAKDDLRNVFVQTQWFGPYVCIYCI